MEHPDPGVADLQTLLAEFAAVERNHENPETGRHENDAEHTLSIAMITWYFYEQVDAGALDPAKMYEYAMVHDLLEAVSEAGDVNAFAPDDERDAKEVAEDAAEQEMAERFPAFPGMVGAIQRYRARADAEAVFVWTVDKLQALIMDERNDWTAHRTYNVSRAAFITKYEGYRPHISPYLEEIFDEWFEYSKAMYWDQTPIEDS